MPRCDHAVFRVADLDRTVAFYERLLPATLVSRKQHADRWRTEIATLRPEGQDDFVLVFLMARRVRWLLWAFHTFVPRQMRSSEHLGFVCASRAELEERARIAREVGARVENALQEVEGKDGWILEVLDPDGNAIEWTHGVVHD
ncbi:MAG: VOC family protein [Planctomycetes bacterium]|nr:VOC family protein [Planctomycetota bacterium]